MAVRHITADRTRHVGLVHIVVGVVKLDVAGRKHLLRTIHIGKDELGYLHVGSIACPKIAGRVPLPTGRSVLGQWACSLEMPRTPEVVHIVGNFPIDVYILDGTAVEVGIFEMEINDSIVTSPSPVGHIAVGRHLLYTLVVVALLFVIVSFQNRSV